MPDAALVLGARGMLGSECVRAAPPALRVSGADRTHADVADLEAVRALVAAARPRIVIVAAAYTAVDAAEADRAAAFRVNATGARNAAIACREAGARCVYVSTDFVFDGTARAPYAEMHAPSPRGAYAESKVAGERAVAETGGDWQIVRTQWLYGARGKHFVASILKAAAERDRLTVVDDQRGCPTCTHDLAPELWRIALDGPPGIYHASSGGEATWHELAREAVRVAGLATAVDPITTAQWAAAKPGAAPRPAYSVLAKCHLERTIGNRFPEWKASLQSYFARGDHAR